MVRPGHYHADAEYLKIQVGDIITTYYQGFFRATEIWQGDLNSPYRRIITFVQVADKHGKPKRSREKSCDGSYCLKFDQQRFDNERAEQAAAMEFVLSQCP